MGAFGADGFDLHIAGRSNTCHSVIEADSPREFHAFLDAEKMCKPFFDFSGRFRACCQLFRKTYHGTFLVGKDGVQPINRQCKKL